MDRKIEFNLRTLLLFLGAALGLYIVWRIRGVLFIVGVAYLVSTAILPLSSWFEKKIPRSAAIFTAYILVILVLVGMGALIFPPLVTESTKLYSKLPEYFTKVTKDFQLDVSFINQNLENFGAGFLKLILAIVANTVEVVTIFVVSIYISFERKHFKKYAEAIFGASRGEKIYHIALKVENRLGVWIRGQLLLDFIVGFETFVGLKLLNFPYAVPLAVTAGILETVPNIGPILSSIPAVIIGFSISPLMGAAALALYVLVQQTENHLIVPRVMAHVAGLRPLAVIIVLLVGGSLMGTTGVILAIPAYLVGATVVEELGGAKNSKF